jgi:dTDP-4-amino-4,6-dideoxygalactose transaminase
VDRDADQVREPVSADAPKVAAERRHVWHLFVCLHPQRDRIRKELEALGVHTGLHYPIPLHLQQAYAHLGGRPGDFPVAEKIGAECFTLPLFAEMTHQQQDHVVDSLTHVLQEVAWQ